MKLALLFMICAFLAVNNAAGEDEVKVDPMQNGDDVQVDPSYYSNRRRPPWGRRPKELQGVDKVETGMETRSGNDQDAEIQASWYRPRPKPFPGRRPPFPFPRPRPRPRTESDVDMKQQKKQQVNERAATGGDAQSNLLAASMPESKNYGVAAEPFWCICCCGRCCNRRRSVEIETRASDDKRTEITVLGSQTELKLYSDPADLLRLYTSKVARAELVTRPLDPATPAQVSDALGGLQHAVVATLTDGRRFLVVKGNQKGEGSETIVILADHMTDDWTKVTTKDVSQSTLGDFIKAGGDSFDALKDNGRHAAQRMMALK